MKYRLPTKLHQNLGSDETADAVIDYLMAEISWLEVDDLYVYSSYRAALDRVKALFPRAESPGFIAARASLRGTTVTPKEAEELKELISQCTQEPR